MEEFTFIMTIWMAFLVIGIFIIYIYERKRKARKLKLIGELK